MSIAICIRWYNIQLLHKHIFLRRAALRTWRQRHGSSATYNNLIKVFERASYNDLALSVRNLITGTPTDADNLSRNLSHTPPPTARLLSRPPQVTATSTVELQIEDQQGGYNHKWHRILQIRTLIVDSYYACC